MKKIILLATLVFFGATVSSQNKNDKKVKTPLEKLSLNGLKFRSVGPALTAGRIADIAVNPNNSKNYYVAVASGGVWKTNNNGNISSTINIPINLNRKLQKTVNILGKETTYSQSNLFIEIYDNGSFEKKLIIEKN